MTSRNILLCCIVVSIFATDIFALGSIFGLVNNSDLSVPTDHEILFFGFIANTDNEIRVINFVGAGYESGNWFDDFQNYSSASPGQQYDYFFFNISNLEFFNLSKTIPDNSFQQEDITLGTSSWPSSVYNIHTIPIIGVGIKIIWSDSGSNSYHIYRRDSISNGSIFRIDNATGDLADFGVTDTFYIDTNIVYSDGYDYMVIADDNLGSYSPPSEIVTGIGSCVDPASTDTDGDGIADLCDNCPSQSNPYQEDANFDGVGDLCETCCEVRGDVAIPRDGSLLVNDIVWLVDFLFRGGMPPECFEEGDCAVPLDNDILVNDIVYMVDALFRGGPMPPPC